jgi:hypothetical protein
MLDIQDVVNNPVFALLLLVACATLWQVVSVLFERITHSKEKQNSAIIEQLRTLNDKLTELIIDVKIISNHSLKLENDIKSLNDNAKNIGITVGEHSKTLAIHSEKIKNLEKQK